MPRANPSSITYLFPPLFVVLWATGFVVARLAAGHVEPFTFLAIRFPIAGLIMLALALWQKAPWPDGALALRSAVAGALLHAAYLGPVYWAVAHGLPGGVAALIVGLQPLLTGLLAAFVLKENISWRHWLGLAAGILGVGLVLAPKLDVALLGGITPLTAGAAVVGALGISYGTVFQKRYATGAHLITGGFWQYAGASAAMLACAAAFESFGFDGSAEAWIALAWSVVVLSIIAILMLMHLIREGEVSRVASLIYLVPAVSAAMTYVLFDETLSIVQIAGMAVCALAVLAVNCAPARPI